MENAAPTTILVVDDSPLCRAMVSKALHTNGLGSVVASDGSEGLDRLAKQHVDAVILDYEMPNMNGLGFLKVVRADPRWKNLPVLMLTSMVTRNFIIEATGYGLSGYLLKAKLSMPEVLSRLKQALAKAVPQPAETRPPISKPAPQDKLSIPNLVARDATLAKIAQITDGKTLNGVVQQINTLCESSRATVTEIANIVKQDPMLSVRVVQRASSAAYGGVKARNGSIEEAVRAIGTAEVRNLAMSMAIVALLGDKGAGTAILRCWQHALAVASIMNRIVLKTDKVPSGLPYSIGLCHDLVEILLRQHFPTEFAAMADFARQTGVPPTDLVRQIFGLSYGELTEALLDRIKLPPALIAPIKECELCAAGTNGAQLAGLARALYYANLLANGAFCTSSPDSTVAPLPLIDCRTALIPTAAINLNEVRSESITTTCMLANASAGQEAELMKPLLPKREVRVWYLRHRNYASLDPVEAALQSLCKVETQEVQPEQNDLAVIHGIVVCAPHEAYPGLHAEKSHPQTGRAIPVLYINPTCKDEDNWVFQNAVSLKDLAEFIGSLDK